MIVAVVPVKRLAEAKSRLSSHLSPGERSALVLGLLRQTISALRDSGVIGRIALATPESGLAGQFAVEQLPEEGSLNASLAGASRWASHAGAHSLLIVPGDLPRITADTVRAFAAAGAGPGIAIAATQDGGTGALLLTPPDAIAPSFGPDSFERHRRLATERGLVIRTSPVEGFSFDLDTVEDLQRAN